MSNIKEFLKTHLAKPDGTTIREHIQDLFNQFEIFNKNYPQILSEKERQLLAIAIEYHDYGKLNKLFQCKLPANPTLKPVKCSKIKDDIIPHNILSPLFLKKFSQDLKFNDLVIIIYAIINHHARGEKYIKSIQGITLLINEIEENITEFFFHIGIRELSEETKIFYKKFLYKICQNITKIENLNKFFDENLDFIISLVKITGLLIKIDHSASGEDLIVEEAPVLENREKLFFDYLKRNEKPQKLRPFQEKFKNSENLVLVADTGLGKTGLAALWSKRKMFYVLPNRTSTNAMFETMKDIFGDENVGLMHSTSLFYIFESARKEDYTVLRDYDNTRNLSKPVSISTADQLFTAVFKYPTYEKIYVTLSYSDIVIDEIQGFDPAQIVPMIRQISETVKLGARYLIITATLPEIIKEEFEKLGFKVNTNTPETIDTTKRHKIEILDKSVFEVLGKIIDVAKNGKNVLVIVNTVGTAQEIFQKLDYENKNLLHSRFIWKTRQKKEKQIKEDYETKKGVIWVTTQLVEASVDIDFDILFTEVATADSLIQRMGRVWRHRKKDYSFEKPNVFILLKVDEKRVFKVYEKSLREKSIELIKENLDESNYLLSAQKRKIVETLYSKKTLQSLGSEYFDKWRDVENVLNSNWDFLFKKEAHQIFRDNFTFEAIPFIFKKEIVELLEKYKKISEIKDRKERRAKRIYILKKINDFKVPVPVYWVSNEKLRDKTPYQVLDKNLNLYLLAEYFVYNEKTGLKVDMEKLKNYNVDEQIFI